MSIHIYIAQLHPTDLTEREKREILHHWERIDVFISEGADVSRSRCISVKMLTHQFISIKMHP